MTDRVPPDEWIPEKPHDWTDYGLRPAPTYEDDDEIDPEVGTESAYESPEDEARSDSDPFP